jgi:hypothetical protein
MTTPAQVLTAQFYEWEQRGRGWFLAENPVELEPVFEPFWKHYVVGDIIDDGMRPHWLTTLFAPVRDEIVQQEARPEPVLAFLSDSDPHLTIFSVTLLKGDKSPLGNIEHLLTMLSYRKSPVAFEIIGCSDTIALQWVCRDSQASFLYTQLKAFFPDVHLAETLDDKVFKVLREGSAFYTVDFGLQEEFMRPLATASHSAEPLTALFGMLEHLHGEQCAIVQVVFTGASNSWSESIMTAVCDESGRNSFFLDDPDMPRLAGEKVSRPLFGVTVRAVASGNDLEDAAMILEHLATALVHASHSPHNRLMPLPPRRHDPDYLVGARLADILMRQSRRLGMLLNCAELATFVHFPHAALRTKKVVKSIRATKAAPSALIGHSYRLGENSHNGVVQEVGIAAEQRLKHLHVMGATGTGKSTLLHALIMQDVCQGAGCMVLDPHGDLIESVLSSIPQERINDVVLIDPSDSAFPVACNILSTHSELEKELLASDLVMVFKRFSTSWGDQMHSVLANALLALLYNTKIWHLGDLRKFLIEPSFRTAVLSTVTDPDITYYWQKEFPILKGGSVGPLLTRLDSFLRPRVIRAMVCQQRGLDMAQLMDSKKIVLVKLAQGLMGAENSYLLGAFIVSKLQQAAMARQTQQKNSRVPFFCYIDEFQNFITPSMAAILSGARKYGLGLVLAHQDMQQVSKLDAEIAGSVLSNAGTRICFRLGDTDAKRMQDGFSAFSADDLQNLPTGEAIARVNTADGDFNLSIVPYDSASEADHTEAIIAHSRTHFSAFVPEASETKHPADPVHQPTKPAPVYEEPVVSDSEPTVKSNEVVREHRYLQAYIKNLAETHGYRAAIEVPTPDGAGQVDVLLERGEERIAIEISVTTSAAWELHNVKKCLAAGYGRVVVCADNQSKRKRIQEKISSELPQREQDRVTVMGTADIPQIFTTQQRPTETVLKGYRVKVSYESKEPRDGILQSIMNATRKPK